MTSRTRRSRTTRKKEGPSIVEALPSPPPENRDDVETLEFLKAIDAFKRSTGRTFPTWTEVLQIVKSLGYRKRA